MSLKVCENTYLPDQILLKNIEDFSPSKRFKIIDSINKSLNDTNWDKHTNLICNKYISKPQNYQIFQVAKLFKKSVGYIIVRESEKKLTSYLSFVAIHNEQQKKGIGKTLLSDSVKKIQELGINKMVLTCREKNCLFYEKFAKGNNFSYSENLIGQFFDGEDKYKVKINFSNPPE
jgi:ribosomal protein S18 acetylase RimI-like enzyme